MYIDEIEREVNKRKEELLEQLQNIVETTKIAKTGYLYVFNKEGEMLLHPKNSVDGPEFVKQLNPETKNLLYKDLVEAYATPNKTLNYKWDHPSDKGNYKYNKVAWLEHVPELDWYVGSSTYIDEFKESSDNVRRFIITLAILILIVSSFFSFIFLKNLLMPITQISDTALQVASGDYSARSEIVRNDEVGILSREFDKMIETTEDLIENLDEKVREKTRILEELNQEITDSIQYASLLQTAIIPSIEKLKNKFEDTFVIWQPKDIVGGDVYLFEELRNQDEYLLMVIDCTGHGVPGAFVTMLVKAIEREVIAKIMMDDSDVNPAVILQHFNHTIQKLLCQEDSESVANAGFDGGIVYINKKEKFLRFSGAQTPLFYIQDDELKMIKGDRSSIGYQKNKKSIEFKNHEVDLSKQTWIYLTTDGYPDQTGGEKGLMFGKKKFKKILTENYQLPFDQQKELLLSIMKNYQKDRERKDDMTIVGLKLGG